MTFLPLHENTITITFYVLVEMKIISKFFENILNLLPILIISTIIFIFYCSRYPGGMAGMAPFALILSHITCTLISSLTYSIVSIRYPLNYKHSIIFFTVISFLLLAFYYNINPFQSLNDSETRYLDLGFYVSILIPVVIVLFVKKIMK